MTSSVKSPTNQWWGEFKFKKDEILSWDFASLEVAVQHQDKEWCVWHHHVGDFEKEQASKPAFRRSMDASIRPESYQRFVFTKTADEMEIFPNLPDRNVVARPISPITLMASQQVTLFVGAILWFSGRLKGNKESLFEVPIRRLSDTWFGPSPRVGELCYASRTHAYIDPSHITHRTYRAIVPVTIKNDNKKDPLTIEKISVPVTMLDLYCDGNGQFWTNSINLTKEAGSTHVQIKVESARRSPYFSSKDSAHLARARKPDQSHLALRAYDMLFS
ncbi:MAG: hypothetical protein R3208_20845 [Ketobacteraceae bacterium]|nr:hypothetical protein [Ketobacteraceae bacterium]